MAEFEPIPEEMPRQSLSSVGRSAHKEGGSADRLSKSSEKHGVKEKKRSSKSKSKGDSPSGGHGHRSGSNSSSKSSSNKHKSEPLISLTSTVDMDMDLSGTTNQGNNICHLYSSHNYITTWVGRQVIVRMLSASSSLSFRLFLYFVDLFRFVSFRSFCGRHHVTASLVQHTHATDNSTIITC